MKTTCRRCGFCCIYADINIGEITKENEEQLRDRSKWLALHRVDSFFLTQGKKRIMVVRIPQVCVNLVYNQKKAKYICKDYDNRPQTCRDWECNLMRGKK